MYTIQRDRLIATFIDLVKIPSPSWREERVIRYIENAVSALGYESVRSHCGASWNLLVRVPGNPARKPMIFGAHTDTVTPCDKVRPIETATKITSDGTTVLGGDDKAAIAVFIEAMRVIRERGIDVVPLEFVFTCAEEIGIKGMKGMDYSLLRAKRAFIFDCSGPIGTMIVRAPSQVVIRAEVTGKAAHAGIEPEKGISAIDIIAEIITKLPKGRLDKESTSNVGIISGGLATNIVAEKASLDMEARSLDGKKLKNIEKKIIGIMKDTARRRGGKISVQSNLEYSSFSIRSDDPLIKTVKKACAAVRARAVLTSSGGGSDTNVLNEKGIRAINLSIGMSNVHSTREFILKKDLVKGCELVLAIAAEG
jgi:tripeptide aminopeptidase